MIYPQGITRDDAEVMLKLVFSAFCITYLLFHGSDTRLKETIVSSAFFGWRRNWLLCFWSAMG
ncbi:MAG: hypothetical protein PHF31_16735 [Methylobacter sp.]|nr:hypothetical protein [Methylobacter sp.]